MEYERIHSVKMGVLSPTKLRMKLLGAQSSRKREGGSNSSRTSPSRIEEMKYAKNSLLAGDLDQEDLDAPKVKLTMNDVGCLPKNLHKEQSTSGATIPSISRNLSYHPQARPLQEDYNGYDSGHDNGSSSSFEFHQAQHSIVGHCSRHVPSKWNEAEKWIANKQTAHPNVLKRSNSQNHRSHQMLPSWLRVARGVADQKHLVAQSVDTKRMVEKLPSVTHNVCSNSLSAANETCGSTDIFPSCGDSSSLRRGNNRTESSVTKEFVAESTVVPAVQSVTMRDIGTEMTPIPSQEPSRTGTPLGATSPTRSPIPSRPSTPGKETPPLPSAEATASDELPSWRNRCKRELSGKELQLKTRREIAALGIQLGKMNIASWASKEEVEHRSPSPVRADSDKHVRMEYETRAAAWEEAEKSKHMARYRGEELKIQAWESQQKAKFEDEMRRVEAQAERMRVRAMEKMTEKLAIMQQYVEEKQASAEARMNRQAAVTARRAEKIRQTGRIPPSRLLNCSCLF